MELEPWVVLESMEVLELWVELVLELKETVLVLELMMMKEKHTVQFLERDFRKKFALTAPLTPPTRAEGVLKLML
jgi:hypothetical protein